MRGIQVTGGIHLGAIEAPQEELLQGIEAEEAGQEVCLYHRARGIEIVAMVIAAVVAQVVVEPLFAAVAQVEVEPLFAAVVQLILQGLEGEGPLHRAGADQNQGLR